MEERKRLKDRHLRRERLMCSLKLVSQPHDPEFASLALLLVNTLLRLQLWEELISTVDGFLQDFSCKQSLTEEDRDALKLRQGVAMAQLSVKAGLPERDLGKVHRQLEQASIFSGSRRAGQLATKHMA